MAQESQQGVGEGHIKMAELYRTVPGPVSALIRGTKTVALISGVLGLYIRIQNVGLIYLVVVTVNSLIIGEVVVGGKTSNHKAKFKMSCSLGKPSKNNFLLQSLVKQLW